MLGSVRADVAIRLADVIGEGAVNVSTEWSAGALVVDTETEQDGPR